MTITIQNDMDEPLETYKIFIPGTNGLIPEYPGSFNFFWHKIKYDDSDCDILNFPVPTGLEFFEVVVKSSFS